VAGQAESNPKPSPPSGAPAAAAPPSTSTPAAPGYPGTVPAYPPAVPAYPGAVPAYPGAVPAYPGAVPAYPGAAPAYPGAAPAYPGAAQRHPGGGRGEGTDIRQYIGIILGRWWLILLFLLLGAGCGVAYIYTRTPLYRAICRIEIVRDPRLTFEDGAARSALVMMDQEVMRRTIVLQSRRLNRAVRDGLLKDWPDEKVPPQERFPRISVVPMRVAQTMLDVSVDATNQKYALDYLSSLLSKYEDERRDDLNRANEKALSSLKTERLNIHQQLEEAQKKLAKFLSERSVLLNEAKARWDERFLASLIQRQNALRMERTMLETQFSMLDKLSAGTIQEVVDLSIETHHATLGQMLLSSGTAAERTDAGPAPIAREQADWQIRELELARLEAEYAEEIKTFKEAHPKMRALHLKIEGVKRDLKLTAEMAVKRLQERHRAVGIQEQALDHAIGTWRAELNLTVAERAEYQQLTAETEHLQKLHDAVFQRVVEGSVLTIDAVLTRSVEDPAPAGKIWPNHVKVMGSAIAISLAAALALALLLHNFDTTLLDIGVVEERFGITYISGIPHWTRLLKTFSGRSNAVLVTREKANVATEVYRTVRGTLEHLMVTSSGGFAMVVTSSDSGDGKSLTALNLAVVFAWTGKRVLLVDGDLRRGALHKALGVESGVGFGELLTGSATDWQAVVRKGLHGGLDFVSSGQYLQESPEQLGSQRLRELLALWRQAYDIIIFDTAPVSRVMDTAVLARSCDGVLLVARFAKTRLAELQHLLRRLEGTRILGFCVNCIDFHRLSRSYYGYSGYSGYGYRDYGYGYYRYYSYYRPYGEKKREATEATAATAPNPPPPAP
jgi:capsular exopolysaccharide synthesis family protein